MARPRVGSAYVPLLRSYVDSDKVNAISIAAEMLYLRLLAVSDDAGRYWARPHLVLGKALTKRWEAGEIDVDQVAALLEELAAAKLIIRDEEHLEITQYHGGRGRKDREPLIRFPEVRDGFVNQTATKRSPNGATGDRLVAPSRSRSRSIKQEREQETTRAREEGADAPAPKRRPPDFPIPADWPQPIQGNAIN